MVIDPVRTRTAALADQHLRINPGSDQALAFGLMHVIIGENLHDREYIEKFTQGFAALAEKARAYDPERVAGLTGIAQDDIIQLAREYATIAAGGDSRELRDSEERTRRRGDASDRGIARAHRLMERGRRRVAAFGVAGVPVQSEGAGDAGTGDAGAHHQYD